jgi:hypothetical protein
MSSMPTADCFSTVEPLLGTLLNVPSIFATTPGLVLSPGACFFEPQPSKKNRKTMTSEFQQYRYARIEAQNIMRARLEAEFKDGITDIESLENAVARVLAAESASLVPWRRSEIEQLGCRDGMQMAALEFFWLRQRELRQTR